MEHELVPGLDLDQVGSVPQRFLEDSAVVGAREFRVRLRSGRVRDPPSAAYRAHLADRVPE